MWKKQLVSLLDGLFSVYSLSICLIAAGGVLLAGYVIFPATMDKVSLLWNAYPKARTLIGWLPLGYLIAVMFVVVYFIVSGIHFLSSFKASSVIMKALKPSKKVKEETI